MRFGSFAAVSEVTLDIRAGEFFSFLGPSGCGKTTILRLISGFMEPSAGVVRIGGQDMRGIGPNRRPTALIFQNLALFPLMRVWENIAFGLEVRGIRRAERRRRAERLLELVALPDLGDRLVSELSGGQRQRVAIARALAVEPAILLLDEPLSALDLKLRQHMRAELRALQRQTGVTFIYITHDQGEALTMSDRVAVMSQGVLEQVGGSSEIYDHPATAFVATFVGETNAFAGTIARIAGGKAELATGFGPVRGRNPRGLGVGDRATAFVRPERTVLIDGTEPETVLESAVARLDFEGAFVNLFLNGDGARDVIINRINDGSHAAIEAGQRVRFGFAADSAVILPAEGAAEGAAHG